MARFIYCFIYCRYLCPGECVIWDRGSEFCNKVTKKLCEDFGVEVRVIARGRPQSNGIAESQVKNVKRHLKSIILEQGGSNYPEDWDDTMLHTALQILRSDPASAHGFAPAELMIGRPLVFPMEIENCEIDFEGSSLTLPLVQKLKQIREKNFKTATKKIKKHQRQYTRAYNKKHKVKPHNFKVGDKVQYKRIYSKSTLKKRLVQYSPVNSYHIITKILHEKMRVVLVDTNGKVLKRIHSIYNLRKYPGKG